MGNCAHLLVSAIEDRFIPQKKRDAQSVSRIKKIHTDPLPNFQALVDARVPLCYKLCPHLRHLRTLEGTGGGPAPVTPVFDIFRIESDGSLHWCEAAHDLEDAKNRARELAQGAPGQYAIQNKETGERVIVDSSTPRAEQKRAAPSGSAQAWYHICRVDKEKLRWVEAAETLSVAEARIKVLKAFYPGDYLVLDYNPERRDSPAPWTPLSVVLSSLGL